ncbi:hypothetical protein [Delftia sp. JD2]|uniref:hypothetical protein n=1 Tax=Delftia sp. JD2 TaxID=469553 RepID=UPI001111AE39|nr:hypothetical protein [Delftia sp. JD2]
MKTISNFIIDEEIKLCDAFPLEGEDAVAAVLKIKLDMPELATYEYLTIFSSIYIDQGEIKEKLSKLNGLKEKMLPLLLKKYEYNIKYEIVYELSEDIGDVEIEEEFIQNKVDYINEILREAVEQQIKDNFDL